MLVVSSHRSPNFTDLVIPVEFVVLHYTAASLSRTLEIFCDKSSEVSAHIVIDCDGTVYEVVPCLDGSPKRAWHAGRSRFVASLGGVSRTVEGFNDFSIGIELVNDNGNIFTFSDAQYAALFSVIERLKGLYPALQKPQAVVGHEQIAGFRGKADPGRCFEWQRFFEVCYPTQGVPTRDPRCSSLVADRLKGFVSHLGVSDDPKKGLPKGLGEDFFEQLSLFLESTLADHE